ncbi:MAG TPA: urease accessory protein UreD [Terriglobia bacterium]|nr:urease accessory protein UreD [Terriglobia bacterium]
MPPPLAEVGRRGRFEITFGVRHGETAILDSYCEVPFKITRLQHKGLAGIPHLILMQSTAGLFGGDTVECAIHVRAGARVLVTQQSATKVHPPAPPLRGVPAVQITTIRVESGAELRLYFDPVIPFSGARVSQRVDIELKTGARLHFWEGLMAGRIARGEVWQFDEFASETRVSIDGRLRYLDRFCLAPGDAALVSSWGMGASRYLATGLVARDHAELLSGPLHEALPRAGVDAPVPELLVARVVETDGVEFHRARSVFADLMESETEGR